MQKRENTRDRLGQCQSLHFLYQKQVSGSDTPGCISNTLKACAKALIGERKSQGHRITWPLITRSWVHPRQSPTLPVAAHKELDWFGSKMLRSSPVLLVIMASFQESASLFWPFSPQSLRVLLRLCFGSQQLPLGGQRTCFRAAFGPAS